MTHPTFTDMSVTINAAAPAQADAISALFSQRMANALIDCDEINLGDAAACAERLVAAGFGERLIEALLPDAQRIASDVVEFFGGRGND